VQSRAGDRDAHQDAHSGQCDPDAQRRFHGRPPGSEPAFAEDHHQRGETEGLGEVGVVVLDPEPGFPEQDADRQVEQQRGQTEPDRHPHGEHGQQEHGATGAKDDRELIHVASRPAAVRAPE
jgi:hypothetical protein